MRKSTSKAMKCQAIVLVCLTLLVSLNVLAQRWEFGYDPPDSDADVIANERGEINIFENTKYVELDVPQCTSVDYVQVQVVNLISNPTVTFDKHTNIVVITYKPWQISAATYNITAKGKPKPNCEVTWQHQKQPQQQREKQQQQQFDELPEHAKREEESETRRHRKSNDVEESRQPQTDEVKQESFWKRLRPKRECKKKEKAAVGAMKETKTEEEFSSEAEGESKYAKEQESESSEEGEETEEDSEIEETKEETEEEVETGATEVDSTAEMETSGNKSKEATLAELKAEKKQDKSEAKEEKDKWKMKRK